jgi:hypothetical protein
MSLDLDNRGRRAAENLRSLIEEAPLAPSPLRSRAPRRFHLRPALVGAALVLAATAATALVINSIPAPVSSTTTVTAVVDTTSAPTVTTAAAATVTTGPAADVTPPGLTITYPSGGAVLHEKMVAFTGLTEPGARVLAGRYEADVAADGSWRLLLVLSEGSNRVRFVARDSAGNQSEASVTVVFVPPTTTTSPASTTTTEKALAEFTAHATFGTCPEQPPYDIYYGVGEPGSKVTVHSEYGGGSTVVGPQGEWEIQVFFPEAPLGEPILVKVFDQYGRQKSFEFTAVG